MNCKSRSHSKYLLQYHVIFVCKYRKQILSNEDIVKDIKRLSLEICEKHEVTIKCMEADRDHIHYMIETIPNCNLTNLIRTMKSYITYHIWETYGSVLRKYFWNEHTFWTDGYFICSIGNVSEETLRKYIDNQG